LLPGGTPGPLQYLQKVISIVNHASNQLNKLSEFLLYNQVEIL
jgi:hypothetical protein